MNFNFTEALRQLGPNAAFQIANAARPPANYLWNTILPERQRTTYEARNGNMTIRSTMAGLVGMDSAYPPVGVMDTSTFNENIAKIAARAEMTEQMLRELQQFLVSMRIRGGNVTKAQMAEVLNFTQKILVQPHLDTAEYLRGMALTTGALDWTFNGIRLEVDYGVPAGNILAQRTGTERYGDADSTFWEDVKWHRRRQRTGLLALIMNPDLADEIVNNPANELRVTAGGPNEGRVSVRRIVPSTGQDTVDALDAITLVIHDQSGEVYDATRTKKTRRVPFCPRGVMVGIGTGGENDYRIGEGSTVVTPFELGYTHVGPTVEGGMTPGRWAEVYTPERTPWQLAGRSVTNLLPVIENPDKITISSTLMVEDYTEIDAA